MTQSRKHPVLYGTLLLSATGLVCRFMGFFFKIFLARIFGQEKLGIYQMVMPFIILALSLSAMSFQTGISKLVAEQVLNHTGQEKWVFASALLLALPLSLFSAFLLFRYSHEISLYLLKEPVCEPLIHYMAFGIPFSALHTCLNGYFYGLKDATIPALSQFIEQTARILATILPAMWYLSRNQTPPLMLLACCFVISECIACLLPLIRFTKHPKSHTCVPFFKPLLVLTIPLTANRVTITLLQSMEASALPESLRRFGLTASQALSLYGVLTGMALPLILFPSALTSSAAVMILPVISQQNAARDQSAIRSCVIRLSCLCSLLGSGCMLVFVLFGKLLGELLFHNALAGQFIRLLGFSCPFLYLTIALAGVLQGLGKNFLLFFFNASGMLIRLGFLYFVVPAMGIKGYFLGILCNQLFLLCSYFLCLYRSLRDTRA